MAAAVPPLESPTPQDKSAVALRWSGAALAAIAWISGAIFGLYILAFYGGALPAGRLDDWNRHLPHLYDARTPWATLGMGAHLLTGASLLLLGPIQLIGGLRRRWPALHRWTGRVYVTAAAVAGLGGLTFVLLKGTIGGAWMNAGFGLSGALTTLAAFQALRYGRARALEPHRAWGVRLFALVIGSWLYRIEYGFWLGLAHGGGHTHAFNGPVDRVMDFFFYVPNLILAEIFIRARGKQAAPALRGAGAAILALASLVVAVGTYFFTAHYWGAPILAALSGRQP